MTRIMQYIVKRDWLYFPTLFAATFLGLCAGFIIAAACARWILEPALNWIFK